MARQLFLCFVFLCCTARAQTREEFEAMNSAEHYLTLCRPIANASELPNGRLNLADKFDTGQCSGALDTLSTLAAIQDHGMPILGFCPPPKHTQVQWAAIFIDYTMRHPKRYPEPFAIVAIAALQEAYACGK
jgi:Rap1a immunity proteins